MEPHSVTRYLAELINASTTPWLGTRDHDHMGTVGCFQFFFTLVDNTMVRYVVMIIWAPLVVSKKKTLTKKGRNEGQNEYT